MFLMIGAYWLDVLWFVYVMVTIYGCDYLVYDNYGVVSMNCTYWVGCDMLVQLWMWL